MKVKGALNLSLMKFDDNEQRNSLNVCECERVFVCFRFLSVIVSISGSNKIKNNE